jgi:O-antigen ligase
MRILLGILYITVISVSDIFLFRIGLLPFEPSKVILPMVFLLVFINKNYWVYFRSIKGPSFSFLLGISLISILFSFFSSHEELSYVLGLTFLSLGLYISSFLFFSSLQLWQIKIILFVSFLVLGFSVVYELIFSNNVVTRGAGFAENPNSSALRILFLFTILMYLFTRKKHKILLLGLAIVFIFSTLSRSGMLILLLIFVLFHISNYGEYFNFLKLRKRLFRTSVFFFFLILGFFNSIDFIVDYVPAFQHRAAMQRIEQIMGRSEFISDGDESEEGRVAIAKDYFDLFLKQPIGYGTGMSFNRDFYIYSTHNMYLRFLIDFGLIGLSIFLVFMIRHLFLAFRDGDATYISFILIILMGSFFTNTLMENRTFIISLVVLDVLVRRKRIIKYIIYDKNF